MSPLDWFWVFSSELPWIWMTHKAPSYGTSVLFSLFMTEFSCSILPSLLTSCVWLIELSSWQWFNQIDLSFFLVQNENGASLFFTCFSSTASKNRCNLETVSTFKRNLTRKLDFDQSYTDLDLNLKPKRKEEYKHAEKKLNSRLVSCSWNQIFQWITDNAFAGRETVLTQLPSNWSWKYLTLMYIKRMRSDMRPDLRG